MATSLLHGGGGLSNSKLASANSSAGDVLSGKTFYAGDKTLKTGTMPNQGAVGTSLNCSGSYTIPAGYHNGSGVVTANSLASQTWATASASDILSDKTAWVSGNYITGTMTNQGTVSVNQLGAGESYTIPKGFHSGSAVIRAKDLASQTGNWAANGATAADIRSGKWAYVNGSYVAGTASMIRYIGQGTSFNVLNICSELGINYWSLTASNFIIEPISGYDKGYWMQKNGDYNVSSKTTITIVKSYSNGVLSAYMRCYSNLDQSHVADDTTDVQVRAYLVY